MCVKLELCCVDVHGNSVDVDIDIDVDVDVDVDIKMSRIKLY